MDLRESKGCLLCVGGAKLASVMFFGAVVWDPWLIVAQIGCINAYTI